MPIKPLASILAHEAVGRSVTADCASHLADSSDARSTQASWSGSGPIMRPSGVYTPTISAPVCVYVVDRTAATVDLSCCF